MKNKTIFIAIAMLLCNHIFGQNQPTLVDFEFGNYAPNNNTINHVPGDQADVDNNYFYNVYGVFFSSVDDNGNFIDFPKYAKVGSDVGAFTLQNSTPVGPPVYNTQKGIGGCDGYDERINHPLNTTLDEGCWFLTDDVIGGNQNPNTLRIDYNLDKQQCKNASGYLIDVDGNEAFHIRVYTNGNLNTPEKELLISSPTYVPNPGGGVPQLPANITESPHVHNAYGGDGDSRLWEFNTNHYINRIEIDYIGGIVSNVGIAFDEFSFCTNGCGLGAQYEILGYNDEIGRLRLEDQSLTDPNATVVSRTWRIELLGTNSRIFIQNDPILDYIVPIAGHYEVCLEVTTINEDGECCTNSFCQVLFLDILAPEVCIIEPDFFYSCFTDDCIFQFNGNSGDANRNIKAWHWTFGDGTHSFGQNPIHTYSSPGQYEICLTVTGAKSAGDVSCCVETICRTINFNCKGVDPLHICDPASQNQPFIDNTQNEISPQQTPNEAISDLVLSPNPVTNTSTLKFNFNKPQNEVKLILVEAASGRQIVLMNNERMDAGEYSFPINGNTFSPGTYIIMLRTEQLTKSVRMINISNK